MPMLTHAMPMEPELGLAGGQPPACLPGASVVKRRLAARLAWALLGLGVVPGVWAQEPGAGDTEAPTAAVEIDGRVLFRVRGTSSMPAEQRADAIGKRILALARDDSFSPDGLTVAQISGVTAITARGQPVMAVLQTDARLEQADAPDLALAHMSRIRTAMAQFRQERSADHLLRQSLIAAGVLGAFGLAAALVFWLRHRLLDGLDARIRQRLDVVEKHTHHMLEAQRLATGARRGINALGWAAVLVAGYFTLGYTLSLFPWGRALAERLLEYVVDPLRTFGLAFIQYVPSLIFLILLVFVMRFALRLTRMFFDAVGRGRVEFSGFEAEWADPTYKLVRLVLVLFGLVVAYPYIPGSGTDAFKGVSLFAGLVFSLSSTATLGNLIAGYTMTYRRAFRMGDRVKIGDTVGDVTQMRLQVTHLRTAKNEEVVIPNSLILNSEVVNYSSLARTQGLILHTSIGIGYETPWRQVEAMLLAAARRTSGLLEQPPPFVLQTSLGDFAITYQLNAYCNEPHQMAALYSAMHRNILDVFNEHRVQIMTPAYEGDPELPKVVPKEDWYLAPASREGAQQP